MVQIQLHVVGHPEEAPALAVPCRLRGLSVGQAARQLDEGREEVHFTAAEVGDGTVLHLRRCREMAQVRMHRPIKRQKGAHVQHSGSQLRRPEQRQSQSRPERTRRKGLGKGFGTRKREGGGGVFGSDLGSYAGEAGEARRKLQRTAHRKGCALARSICPCRLRKPV